jgi:hypothetical protein
VGDAIDAAACARRLRGYREIDGSDASFASAVSDLLTGQFSDPDTAKGWSRDCENVSRR